MLILVCGLPGTGKSTVARQISEKAGAPILRTDAVRKEITEKPEYSEEEKRKVYEELFRRAESLLRKGKNVIIDGTFYKKTLRNRVSEISERTGKELKMIECVSPEDVIRKRISGGREDESEADFGVYEKIRDQWEPIESEHITLDTSGEWKRIIENMLEKNYSFR